MEKPEKNKNKINPPIHYMAMQMINHLHFQFFELFNSHMTCLDDLIDTVINMYVDDHLNHHLIGWS